MTMEEIKKAFEARDALLTPAGDGAVSTLETEVNLPLTEDYKAFLREIGTVFLEGKEVYGLGVPDEYYLNVGHALRILRQLPDYPMTMLPLVSGGDGTWLLYENQRDSVFSWQVAGEVRDQGKNLPAFLQNFFKLKA